MRISRFLPFLLLVVATPALSQVTTNDQALQALKPVPGTLPSATGEMAPAHPAHRTVRRQAPVVRHTARPAPAPMPPAIPAAPPANPVIAPPAFVMPAHPRPNPPPVPVKPDAIGTVSEIPQGTRITFGPGSSSLNPAMNDALLAIAARAKANPGLQISVTAWAPGSVDDPSVPRTLSLERALAARAVLINAGIPSERILAVADGLTGIGGGPADRLEIVLEPPRSTPAPTHPG